MTRDNAETGIPPTHDNDPFPEHLEPTPFGVTVACAEGRCDNCSGQRKAWHVDHWDPYGPCTHRCHKEAGQ